MRQSQDESQNYKMNSSRRWKIEDAVERVESRLRLNRIAGQGQTSRAGFGLIPREKIPHPSSKAYRKVVSQLFIKAVQQKIQGSWTRWQKFMQREMSWNSLLSTSPAKLVSFALGATNETIASPANFKRWGLAESSSCELCHRGCDVKHVLSGCEVALSQGRYKYRHDAVLRRLMHGLSQDINKANNSKEGKKIVGMEFVREGQAVVKKPKPYRGILQEE